MPIKDPVLRKQKMKEWSRKHYLKNREKIIERTRQFKLKNKELNIEHSRAHRRRIDPTLEIEDCIGRLSRGDCTRSELVRFLRKQIDEINRDYGNHESYRNKAFDCSIEGS